MWIKDSLVHKESIWTKQSNIKIKLIRKKLSSSKIRAEGEFPRKIPKIFSEKTRAQGEKEEEVIQEAIISFAL